LAAWLGFQVCWLMKMSSETLRSPEMAMEKLSGTLLNSQQGVELAALGGKSILLHQCHTSHVTRHIIFSEIPLGWALQSGTWRLVAWERKTTPHLKSP
jgi:hypothetical protein